MRTAQALSSHERREISPTGLRTEAGLEPGRSAAVRFSPSYALNNGNLYRIAHSEPTMDVPMPSRRARSNESPQTGALPTLVTA